MVMLVSLNQASEHLRRDTSDDDADLTLKIKAASRAVLNYLKTDNPHVDFLDTAGEVPVDTALNPIGVPEEIQIATLMLIGVFYRDREGNQDGGSARVSGAAWQMGYLPPAVMAVLYPLRPPEVI